MQNPLNLLLTIKDGQNLALEEYLLTNSAAINAALTSVGTVHFARFLPVKGTQLLFVVTSYDGDFDTYIEAFTAKLGTIFDDLFGFMVSAPPLPVKDNLPAFEKFVQDNNTVTGLYSAYPDCTVIQIWSNGCSQPSNS